MSKQKIKFKRIQNKLLKSGINISRVNNNVLSISSVNNIGLTSKIMLPDTFEIEEKAISQLLQFSNVSHYSGKRVKCSCATPDFHTGTNIPVGSVVLCDKDMVIPQAIGTDINCGMRLHTLNINYDEFLSKKDIWINLLKGDLLESSRNIPTTKISMQAMFENGLSDFFTSINKNNSIGLFKDIDLTQSLKEAELAYSFKGNIKYAPESLVNFDRDFIRDSCLGTIGKGNHFVELQIVSEILDKQKAYEHGIIKNQLVVMIHSGSRDVGHYIGQRWMDIAKHKWPNNLKYPEGNIFSLVNKDAEEYITAMNTASNYANLNRAMIAEMIRQRTRQVFNNHLEIKLIVDIPHNIISQEKIGNVHRKGATPAYEGQLLLIPGSMGDDSYLLNGLGNDNWLQSASHGAGRNFSRNEMSFKHKLKTNSELDSIECITLREERKIEEAPSAYKKIGPVIQSQIEEKTVSPIAKFSPILTFKA